MNPEVKLKVKNAINEIVIHLDKISSENDGIKSILKELKETGINTKAVRKVAKAIHKGNSGEANAELSETQDMFEEIIGFND